ncbi:MAG TPA: polymer-forming cytoskeletal protein [Kofleriaceae bacterium]|nr:polymer-forming cytoskeletal protein [Kofleriaceae bacterium]
MAAPARAQGALGEINTLLGKGTTFEGKLTFEGTVRIDGKLKGEVFSDDVLIIGEGAYVEAEIDIGEVIIQGTVVGNIRAKRAIEIHAPGKMKGDLHTPSLQVDKGVIFEGRSFMEAAAGTQVAQGSSAPSRAATAPPGPPPGGGGAKPTPVK